MLNSKEMETCLDHKIQMIKTILRLQLEALEMYDASPADLEILCKNDEIENLKQQVVNADLEFLFHYKSFLASNGVETLDTLSKIKQRQFKMLQDMIEQIEVLTNHQKIQDEILKSIFYELMVLKTQNHKNQQVSSAYKKSKK